MIEGESGELHFAVPPGTSRIVLQVAPQIPRLVQGADGFNIPAARPVAHPVG